MDKQDPSLNMLTAGDEHALCILRQEYPRLPFFHQIPIFHMALGLHLTRRAFPYHGSCIFVSTCECVRMGVSVSIDRNGDAKCPDTFSRGNLFHVPLPFILMPLASHGMSVCFSGILSQSLMQQLRTYRNSHMSR